MHGSIRAMVRRLLMGLAIGAVFFAPAHSLAQRYHTPIDQPQQAEVDRFFSGSVEGAFEHAGQTVLPPAETAPSDDESAMSADTGGRAMDGVAGRQASTFRPDRITDFEGSLGYQTVFTPSIAPFKRVTVLSVVALAADQRTPILLPRGGAFETMYVSRAKADHDSFWGSVVLDFSKGLRVPLPSVAPQSRFLEARVSSPLALSFERDANDVFFVRAERDPGARIRFNFLMDAPRKYFAREIPNHRANLFAHRLPPMPSAVKEQAQQVTDSLALSSNQPLSHVLSALTGHFRSFVESSEPPLPTPNIYLDLALGMKGVCRHRAYAFVITAQSLGVHARFVMNEAHAWVEVEVEPGDWLRIDLGGAADGFRSDDLEDRPQYEPAEQDTLPKPASYQASNELAANASSGDGAGNGAGEGEASGTGEDGVSRPQPSTPEEDVHGTIAATGGYKVTAETTSYRAFRGQTLTVRGFVRDAAGRPAPPSRLEARFSGTGAPAAVTLTKADGSFSIEVPIAIDAEVGRKGLELVLSSN